MRFSEYLDRAAGLYPAHEAFVDGEFRINYKSARDIVHKIANVLSSSGPLAQKWLFTAQMLQWLTCALSV